MIETIVRSAYVAVISNESGELINLAWNKDAVFIVKSVREKKRFHEDGMSYDRFFVHLLSDSLFEFCVSVSRELCLTEGFFFRLKEICR